jgi:hypothetical protein
MLLFPSVAMKNLLSIPREALAELLQAAGSPLTPEQYLASLAASGPSVKYRNRAWVAAVSSGTFVVLSVLSLLLLPLLGFDLEDVIVVAGLATVTFFEYRVRRYFLEGNPAAPGLGFRNQAIFAAAIMIYCLYHAFAPIQVPAEYSSLLDPDTMASLRSLTQLFYLLIGIVGGLGQFGLAWYYRVAGPPT